MNTNNPNKLIKPRIATLEPYAEMVLAFYTQGHTNLRIALWLKEPPRNIQISRQGVSKWIRTRLKKMSTRAAAFGGPIAFAQLLSTQNVQISSVVETPVTTPLVTQTSTPKLEPVEAPKPPLETTPAKRRPEPWNSKAKPLFDMSDLIRESIESPARVDPFVNRPPRS